MNILHVLSNRKWTERSEPVTDLVLAQQRAGAQSFLACGRWTPLHHAENGVEARARAKGVEPFVLELPKHFDPLKLIQDIPALRAIVREKSIEIVHAHMANAHVLAALAAPSVRPEPLILRSSYEPEGPAPGLRSRWLIRRRTAGLIVISEEARSRAAKRFGLPPDRIRAIEPGIDTEFFNPEAPAVMKRADFGLRESDFVIGMVSRIRKDRRADLPVLAVHRLREQIPGLRLLLVGHGEDEKEIRDLTIRLGLQERILLPGYCRGPQLAAAYRVMDALVYPVPGTDPSCRTVREAMASGLPVVASRLGFLKELVEDGVTGRFMELDAESLASILFDLHAHRTHLQEMAGAALATARRRWPLRVQAERTLAFYEALRQTIGRARGGAA